MKVTKLVWRSSLIGAPLLLAALALALPQCHLDGPIVRLITDDDHFRPPLAPPTFVYGQFASEAPMQRCCFIGVMGHCSMS